MTGTREYPRVAPRAPVPVWAVVLMTLVAAFDVAAWGLFAWRATHG